MPRPKANPSESVTRRKLLDAGLDEFHSHGFNATGVDTIARTASVPKGSFYNHFGSKQAFGAEVVDCYFERHLVKLRHFLVDTNTPPLQRLRNYFDERIAFFTGTGAKKGCLMGNMALELADSEEIVRSRLASRFDEWALLLRHCIEQAQVEGQLQVQAHADAGTLADFVLNSWEGALLRMKVDRSIEPLKTARHLILTSILR